MKQRMAGFQKPLDDGQRREVYLPVVSITGPNAKCSCGWAASHSRKKILDDKIQTHLDKHHQGRGLWV